MNATASYHNSGIQNLSTGSESIFFDLNAAPWLPCNSWKVTEHREQGIREYNPRELFPYESKRQLGKHLPTGYELKTELTRQMAFNVNYLTELFKYREKIPESFKEIDLVFLGTIFLDPKGREMVLYLHYYWQKHEYRWLYKDMSETFGPDFRIAILKPAAQS